MQRSLWRFNYSVSGLKAAAEAKQKFHQSRFEFWTRAKQTTLEEIRADGIDVVDSVAGAGYSNKDRYAGAQIVIKPGVEKKLYECQAKIQEHLGKVADYAGWVQLFAAQAVIDPNFTLPIDADDYTYFFGNLGTAEADAAAAD